FGAMPSIVVTDRFWASAASTRQDGTSLPSRRIEHAPQSPVEQPSLVPVRPTASRSALSSVCDPSQRNSTGSPLIVVSTWILNTSVPAFHTTTGDGRSTPRQHAGNLTSICDRSPFVVNGPRRRASRSSRSRHRLVVQPAADERGGRFGHVDRCWCDRG